MTIIDIHRDLHPLMLARARLLDFLSAALAFRLVMSGLESSLIVLTLAPHGQSTAGLYRRGWLKVLAPSDRTSNPYVN